MVAVGEEAPDFELMNDAGEAVKLSDFRGKHGSVERRQHTRA